MNLSYSSNSRTWFKGNLQLFWAGWEIAYKEYPWFKSPCNRKGQQSLYEKERKGYKAVRREEGYELVSSYTCECQYE